MPQNLLQKFGFDPHFPQITVCLLWRKTIIFRHDASSEKPIKWQFSSFTNPVLKVTILTEPHWRQNTSRTFMTKN